MYGSTNDQSDPVKKKDHIMKMRTCKAVVKTGQSKYKLKWLHNFL